MNKNTNFLATIFDWLGEVFEVFNPAAFRFLAAFLPYLTPVPVAALTASSATTFLHFSNTVSGIFVFALEGIGLWFTTLLVDTIVEAIRSKNTKSWFVVLLFAIAVGSYITILVNLNVTLEEAVGNMTKEYSRVITLLCFLPLITGIGNGYYKLMLKRDTELETAKRKQEELTEKVRRENNDLKLKRVAIKHGFNPFAQQEMVVVNQDTPQVRNQKSRHAGDYRDYVMELLNLHGELPLTEITKLVNKEKRTSFVHKDVKGTWYKYVNQWKANK
jgi:hypothetical protein